MLERVQPLPATANLPLKIALQTKSKVPLALLIVLIGVPLLGAGVGVFLAITKTREAHDRAKAITAKAKANADAVKRAYVAPEDRPPRWQGMSGALVVDVVHERSLDRGTSRRDHQLLGRNREPRSCYGNAALDVPVNTH
jgi:hypothetical protein